MTPKEFALELTSRFNDHVNPYIGSGMLSNSYDDGAILSQSKKCALIAIGEMKMAIAFTNDSKNYVEQSVYLGRVKDEIEKL